MYPLMMAGQFNPATIPNLSSWHRADAITGKNDGDSVTTWSAFFGGSGFDVTQGTSGQRPVYKTNIVNGFPVVRFDGSDDRLLTSGAVQSVNASDGTWTAFAVAYLNASAGNTAGICNSDPSSGTRVAQYLRYEGNPPSSPASTTATVFRSPSISTTTDTGPSVSITAWHVDEAVATTTTVDRLVDGTSNGTSSFATALVTSSTVFAIGNGTGGSASLWKGDIAEVLIYGRNLSSTERSMVRRYLGSKYAVTVT